MDDFQLEDMTVKELRQLKERVDTAIRAAIAKSRIQSQPKLDDRPTTDLERERQAWEARKKIDEAKFHNIADSVRGSH